MWRINKLQLFVIQILNYTYFEITIFHRFQLFFNHIYNTLSKRLNNIEVSRISLNKIFVISLSYRLDRRKAVKELFEKRKLNFYFFDAFHLNSYNDLNQYFTRQSLKYLSHGSLGCAFSHMKLLEQISTYHDNEYFIIFEDDILLNENFKLKLNSLIDNYPIDADMFFLGTRNERKRDYKFRCNYGYNKTYNSRLGAYAYILNPKNAKKIIELIKPMNLLCGGIDTAIGKLIRQNKIKAYQFEQSIVIHDSNSPSNIFNPSAKTKKVHFKTNCNWPLKIDKEDRHL